MSEIGASLPAPAPLRRAALLRYQWGEQHFEVLCSACSVRVLRWPQTGERLTWLHCKAIPTRELNPEGPTGLMNVLIPAHYVTGIEPGPTFQLKRAGPSRDIGIFPPNQPTPEKAVPLEEIERVLLELLDPTVN
jgi:hypothetical protein